MAAGAVKADACSAPTATTADREQASVDDAAAHAADDSGSVSSRRGQTMVRLPESRGRRTRTTPRTNTRVRRTILRAIHPSHRGRGGSPWQDNSGGPAARALSSLNAAA